MEPAVGDRAGQGRKARGIAVSAEGVSKSFLLIDEGDAFRIAFGGARGVEKFEALRDITLRAPKGQFVGILGLNGAGKTTLLRTLGGIYAPDSGEIHVRGSLGAIYELGVAGNAFLTGRQYIERMLELRGVSGRERIALLEDAVEFCELGERIDDRVQSYSTGMAGRLFFAVATAGFYDVYLIDEVLAVGDRYFQAKCMRRIKARLARGASGVLVTHDWTTILKVCSEAHILEKGRFAYSGPPELVVRRYLYGKDLAEPYQHGIARLVRRPEGPLLMRAGEPFELPLDIEIERAGPVHAVAAIERLRPGTGWETVIMSRAPQLIGDAPGRARANIRLDATPLAPGEYVLNVTLVQIRGPKEPRIALDGFGWLNGSGVPLIVEGEPGAAYALPARWMFSQP
ncbi:MAG TPA: ABC transporter ATP-binding protein [Caulobacterales bacterium]|nr:ABC transporter ATP-binding protein [Caulobacterales bacterium]